MIVPNTQVDYPQGKVSKKSYNMQMELVVVMVVLTGRGWMQRFQMSSKNQNFTVMNQ